MDCQLVGDKLDALKLPHPAAALLKSFVHNALDQTAAARYLLQRFGEDGPQPFLRDWVKVIQAGNHSASFLFVSSV